MSDLLYLTVSDVATAIAQIDPVAVAEQTLLLHAEGRTMLPEEAYLGWPDDDGAQARSLAMHGLVAGPTRAAGIKIINASLGNIDRGLPRADGLVLMFDTRTARPTALMDGGLISATRTAAVSVAAVKALAPRPPTSLAMIGCGRQASTHLSLLRRSLPSISHVRLYDQRAGAASALVSELEGLCREPADSPEAAVDGADLVITATTVTEGYLKNDWFAPDAVIVHVSLDDLLPEVVLEARTVVVDDWSLVAADHRRLLGRMVREGTLCGPRERPGPAMRRVDGEIGDYLAGRAGRPAGGRTVINPFGMAIQDIALADRVLSRASQLGLGRSLPR